MQPVLAAELKQQRGDKQRDDADRRPQDAVGSERAVLRGHGGLHVPERAAGSQVEIGLRLSMRAAL